MLGIYGCTTEEVYGQDHQCMDNGVPHKVVNAGTDSLDHS